MSTNDHRKQSILLPPETVAEIRAEAVRLERSLSKIVQTAWKIAREDILKMPAAPGKEPT